MNKRNTEGYVLAYVLIVIAVMGMIAATLMTSTLQVITSQEQSIEYMKDKYAAMGEIEKLVAELETSLKDNFTSEDTFLFSFPEVSTFEIVRDEISEKFETLTNGATNISFTIPSTPDTVLDENCTFNYKSQSGSSMVITDFEMPYQVNIISHHYSEPKYPDDPDNPEVVEYTNYSGSLTIKSLNCISYKVSPFDNTSNEVGGDA